jgi:hypothetical protein
LLVDHTDNFTLLPFSLSDFVAHPRPQAYLGSHVKSYQRLEVLAEGSARLVFELNDRLVLKVAASIDASIRAGYGQNRMEALISADPLSNGLVARVFASDPRYKWIIAERCYNTYICDNLTSAKMPRYNKLRRKYRIVDDGGQCGRNWDNEIVMIDYGMTMELAERYY